MHELLIVGTFILYRISGSQYSEYATILEHNCRNGSDYLVQTVDDALDFIQHDDIIEVVEKAEEGAI